MYDVVLRGVNGELTSQSLSFFDRIICIYILWHTHTYMYVGIKESDDQHV